MDTKASTSGPAPAVPGGAASPSQPVYNWVREEGHETIVFHLPGFKKEQLKVQIEVESVSNMKIIGERPLEGNGCSHYSKDFHIPKDCNTNEIQAKFVGGILCVKLPKRTTQDQATIKIISISGGSKPEADGLLSKLNKHRGLVVGVAVAVTVVALGVYANKKLRLSSGEDGN